MTRQTAIVATDIRFWEPGIGSHSRIEQVASLMAEAFDVKILVFRPMDAEARARIDAHDYPFEVIGWENTSHAGAPPAVRAAISEPLQAWYVVAWHAALVALVRDSCAKVVVVEYVRLAYLAIGLPNHVLTVLDSHDVMSMRSISFHAFDQRPSVELSLSDEVALLRCFDFVLAISEPDWHWLRSQLRPSAAILLPYLPHPSLPMPAGCGPTRKLVFAGTNTSANATAIGWFCEQVWPYLRNSMALHVYGSVGSSLPPTILATGEIICHGTVANTTDIYAEYAVCINPTFVGGGLKIKTIEPLTAGLPVVASTEGGRGLEAFSGQGLHIAGSRWDFVTAVLLAAEEAVSPAEWLERRAPTMASLRELACGQALLRPLMAMAAQPDEMPRIRTVA